MKTKNIRLGFKDLFNGRVIYITEPGMPVVEAKVRGFYNTSTKAIAIHFYEGVEKPSWKSDHGDYDILPYSDSLLAELGFGDHKPQCPDPRWVVVTRYHFPTTGVKLEIAGRNGNRFINEFQSTYFDPNESHLRAFKSRARAARYSKLYADHMPGVGPLESFFA